MPTAETSLDGEIVAVDSNGCPSFQALQNRASVGPEWQVVYYAFNLLNFEGEDWSKKPLHERKENCVRPSNVRTCDTMRTFPARRKQLFGQSNRRDSKALSQRSADSLYRPGTRVTTWEKFKISRGQEFVIGGYKPDAASFQSILIGYHEAKKLLFAGKVRQGFNSYVRAKLLAAMRPCLTSKCPFANLPSSRTSHFGEGITTEIKELCWLKPKLVAQISFTESTNYCLLRQATFEGLREDKEPHSVIREEAAG
jgi:bifunctional non-homologous end joining protein LigD